MNALDKIKIDL